MTGADLPVVALTSVWAGEPMGVVLAPLSAALAAALALIGVLARRRRGHVFWFEIGVVYAGIVVLYTVWPLAGYVLLGGSYTPNNDLRLQQLAPPPDEIARIGWLYATHLIGFVVAYLVARGRPPFRAPRAPVPGTAILITAAAAYVVIQGFWWFVAAFFNISAEGYLESYLVAGRLPLLLAQLLGHLDGARYPLALVLLAVLFSRYPSSRLTIAAWLLLTAAVTFVRLGSRSEFVLLLFAAALMYQILVKPFGVRWIAVGFTAVLAAFIVLGMMRNAAAGGEDDFWRQSPFSMSTEFEVLFGNAVHLDSVAANSPRIDIPPAFYVGDVANLLPQQIAPYEKVDAAAWYVNTYFPEYAAAGGGLAFGVIAESVLTGGWPSALLRGVLLGIIFAFVHRLYMRHGDKLAVLVFYVWATTLSYQSLRATTLALLVLFVYRFVPAVAGVTIVAAALERSALLTRRAIRHALPRSTG
jgi:oligosaccharide repeat unit polymerase